MENFFENQEEHSVIKSAIVTKYFSAWAKVMKNQVNEIAYVDLYAGTGYFKDGNKSTPIIILEECINDPVLCRKVKTLFNEGDIKNYNLLKENINKISNIDNMKYKPIIANEVIDIEYYKKIKKYNLIPTFSFIDPFGYKGLTCDLIKSLTKDWGCDSIFFFNYNRINPGLGNKKVEEHINSIFTKKVAEDLRKQLPSLTTKERELLIMDKVCEVFSNNYNNYVLPFRFVSENRNATSHYLVFVSKKLLGYSIMKEIMANLSSEKIDGVGSFSYIPNKNNQLKFIFATDNMLDRLKNDLLIKFKGKILTVAKIYEKHNIGTPYIKKNYKEALKQLEKEKKVFMEPSAESRKKNTLADKVKVRFI